MTLRVQKGREELFNKSYYDKIFGGEYGRSNPSYKLRYLVREIRLFKNKGKLLEIGCGLGHFLKYAKEYFSCYGIETSIYAYNEATALNPDVMLYDMSVETFSINMTFDVVVCFDVLEHISDLDSTFSKIKSFLSEDGILAMIVPTYDSFLGKVYRLIDKDPTHIWKKSRAFWIKKLNFHGFNPLQQKGLFRHLFFGRYYLQFGGAIWLPVMPGIFIIAEKSLD